MWGCRPGALTRRGLAKAIMRLPRKFFARIAPMNLKMRKYLIINDRFLRFMGRIAGQSHPHATPTPVTGVFDTGGIQGAYKGYTGGKAPKSLLIGKRLRLQSHPEARSDA